MSGGIRDSRAQGERENIHGVHSQTNSRGEMQTIKDETQTFSRTGTRVRLERSTEMSLKMSGVRLYGQMWSR